MVISLKRIDLVYNTINILCLTNTLLNFILPLLLGHLNFKNTLILLRQIDQDHSKLLP